MDRVSILCAGLACLTLAGWLFAVSVEHWREYRIASARAARIIGIAAIVVTFALALAGCESDADWRAQGLAHNVAACSPTLAEAKARPWLFEGCFAGGDDMHPKDLREPVECRRDLSADSRATVFVVSADAAPIPLQSGVYIAPPDRPLGTLNAWRRDHGMPLIPAGIYVNAALAPWARAVIVHHEQCHEIGWPQNHPATMPIPAGAPAVRSASVAP